MKPSHPIGRSTSHAEHATRHLNAFRGVRAISEFDWPFTPTHNLIQKLFNAYWLGPPSRVTGTSPWTCVDHSVSRPPHPTLGALFRLAFTAVARLSRLTSPDMVTRRFIMQKARRHPTMGLRPLVGAWFQVLFHSPLGVLFTVPSRYFPLSVSREYLALPDGPGGFAQDSTCPALLRITDGCSRLRIRDFHPLR